MAPVGETNSIDVNRKDGLLYGGSGDNNAYVYDLGTGQHVQTLSGHNDFIHCVKYMPTYNLLATGSEDGVLKLWDTRSNKQVDSFEKIKGVVSFVCCDEKHIWNIQDCNNFFFCFLDSGQKYQ